MKQTFLSVIKIRLGSPEISSTQVLITFRFSMSDFSEVLVTTAVSFYISKEILTSQREDQISLYYMNAKSKFFFIFLFHLLGKSPESSYFIYLFIYFLNVNFLQFAH